MRVQASRILLLMAIAAGCGGDEPPEEQGSAGFVLEGEEPYVSPEDSMQAEADVQEHSESVRARARREAGVIIRGDGRPPAPPAGTGSSPEERYRACMAQADQAEGEVRARLLAACENVRRQPPPEAP